MNVNVILSAISLFITVLTVLMTARKTAVQSAQQTGEILEKLKTLEKSSDALALKVEKNSEKIAELDSRVSRMEGQNEN
jgi:uncharacterized protein YlxW (UPF0749 family)